MGEDLGIDDKYFTTAFSSRVLSRWSEAVQSVNNVLVQLVRATRASTTFPMCSLRLRSATAREISISDICPATTAHDIVRRHSLVKQKTWKQCGTYNELNVLLLDGDFGQLFFSARSNDATIIKFELQATSDVLHLCLLHHMSECVSSHLSCLAFCSRDLLSPITDMAWNQQKQQAH